MPYDDFQSFLRRLEEEGELKRIRCEADPVLEISEITDRVTKKGGPALLFERPKGSTIPLAINCFGSKKRMAMALGVGRVEEAAQEIEKWLRLDLPKGFLDKMKAMAQAMKLLNFPPKSVSGGLCQEVVLKDHPDVSLLPALKCWPLDGGRYLTLGMVLTRGIKGDRNIGLYRIQIYDGRTMAIHWHIHHDGARHWREHQAAGKPMDVAVAFGGDPALIYAATAPLPPFLDEALLAGFLRNKNVEFTRCRTIDQEVPADAEIVLEGRVEPGETRIEGPFGDHTGYYSLEAPYPVFHLTAITHRKNPVYVTTIVGKPVQEDFFMGNATERIFLPLIRTSLPEIADLHMPPFGIFHNFMIVSIRKQFPWHARKVMHGIWGLGQMMFTKIIVVVDEGVDVHDVEGVLWRMGNCIDPGRDIEIVRGPVDVLNHASPLQDAGTKMGIDATKKWPEEGFARPWPEEIVMTPEVKALVDRRWREYGF